MLTIPFLGELDLEHTLLGGQSFRWCADGDGFSGVAGRNAARVQRRGQFLTVDGDGDEAFWRRYFALDADYLTVQARLRADPTLADCVDFVPGVRVLRQEFFETLICFILSACNNIPRITGIVERLCLLCGEELANGARAFPTPEQLAAVPLEGLDILRAGYRARYIHETAARVAAGEMRPDVLRSLPYPEAKQALCTLPGVGGKVADCVLLFSLGFLEAFPRDVHILRAMDTLFPNGLPSCAKGLEGIAQQYIFEYMRRGACPLERSGEVTVTGDVSVRVADCGLPGSCRFVVIFARYGGKWVFARKKGRGTWETPGGHVEPGETLLEAARRELWEETGAEDFDIRPVCDYDVSIGWEASLGRAFLADIRTLGPLPEAFEMAEIEFLDGIPEDPADMTYPAILPPLFARIHREQAI